VHQTSFIIRSTQVDSFGHLNNAAYLELYEWARWEWWAASGLELNEFMKSTRKGPAVIQADVRFQRELRQGDVVTVRTWMHEATRVKVVMGQDIASPEGAIASSARITFVLINLDTRRTAPMAREILARFAEDEAFRTEQLTVDS